MKNNKFFELLIQNNQKKIHEYVISNGKRKSICPIRFLSEEEINNGNKERENSK